MGTSAFAGPGSGPGSVRATGCALCFALAVLAGCATDRPSSGPARAHPKVALLGLEPGVILLACGPEPVALSFPPPNGRLESAAEGAAAAARSVLNTPAVGHPQVEAVIGVIGFAASPFAAAYGALSAGRQRLSADQLREAQSDLAQAMRSNAAPELLRQEVVKAARLNTHRLLACCEPSSPAPANCGPVSAVLEVAVEAFGLAALSNAQNQYVLEIQARARLSRRDGPVVLERRYSYRSGTAPFVDWTRLDGLGSVARTGYQSLADQIARDVFEPVSGPAILLGPGQKHTRASPARFTARTWMRTRSSRGELTPALRFVSDRVDPPATFQVFTRGPGPRPILQSDKATAPESEDPGNTEWTLDGLENDRNSVVQIASCVAAVPMGLWENTLGTLQKHSREQAQKLAATINSLTVQGHFEEHLADVTAASLRSRVVEAVKRNQKPLALSFSAPAELAAASPTAVEIEVVSTDLIGKRSGSNSRALTVQIRATVIRTSDGQELYSCPIRYRSASRKLKQWAVSDGEPLRQELEECSRQTAEALSQELIKRGFVTRNQTPASTSL